MRKTSTASAIAKDNGNAVPVVSAFFCDQALIFRELKHEAPYYVVQVVAIEAGLSQPLLPVALLRPLSGVGANSHKRPPPMP